MPERSKQQARRLPEASWSQAVAMRFTRVSAFLPEVIHWIQSRRATGVMSSQVVFAAGCAANASRRSGGTFGSDSFANGANSSAIVSPSCTPAASSSALSTFSQWLPWPSGSGQVIRKEPCVEPLLEQHGLKYARPRPQTRRRPASRAFSLAENLFHFEFPDQHGLAHVRQPQRHGAVVLVRLPEVGGQPQLQRGGAGHELLAVTEEV